MEKIKEIYQTYPIEFVIEDDTDIAVTDITMEVETFDGGSIYPAYKGDYEITPTVDGQIINIKGFSAKENIVINPIPNNYGKVSYNGVYLKIE